MRLRCRVKSALKAQKTYKNNKTIDLLGCDISFLKEYLENKFTEGMTWDNCGVWHIDHIRPCASFDLTNLEQQKQCFHYTNLQPLWGADNLKKGAKWDGIKFSDLEVDNCLHWDGGKHREDLPNDAQLHCWHRWWTYEELHHYGALPAKAWYEGPLYKQEE